jgi:RND family efflux transporter MFP subunit
MKKFLYLALVVAMVAGAFVAGVWVTWKAPGNGPQAQARKVLYWVDPMHPSYKSDKPGIAPDCGMPLEPVYADDPSGALGPGATPAGIKVSDEKRQLIGVRTGTVDARPIARTIRTVGRVAVDENRLYRLFAPLEGIVTRMSDEYATGGIVEKNALLLSFLPRDNDYLKTEQAYLYALDVGAGAAKTGLSSEQAQLGLQNAVDALVRLGMSETQIAELAKARKPMAEIQARAPVTGYILARDVSPQQRFDRATELYRIADLGRVWILVDVFENDSPDIRPGTQVRVSRPSAPSRAIEARVSRALPQFDADSRTMKIRVEAENADHALRPGMFVDAEIPVALPAAITVPVDAVVDSGTRKTVFIDRGNGYFEPRPVETGWRFDDRVEVVKGLSVSDRIVLSGTFMLDSESRMRTAAMGIAAPVRDPVCGMEIDQEKAKAAGRLATYGGETYYFCSDTCQKSFAREPQKYVTSK